MQNPLNNVQNTLFLKTLNVKISKYKLNMIYFQLNENIIYFSLHDCIDILYVYIQYMLMFGIKFQNDKIIE